MRSAKIGGLRLGKEVSLAQPPLYNNHLPIKGSDFPSIDFPSSLLIKLLKAIIVSNQFIDSTS